MTLSCLPSLFLGHNMARCQHGAGAALEVDPRCHQDVLAHVSHTTTIELM